jgi:hypothetical protein
MPETTAPRFQMALNGGDHFADTLTELVAIVVPGYLTGDIERSTVERYLFGRSVAAAMQAGFNVQAAEHGMLGELTQRQLDLVFADKAIPVVSDGVTPVDCPVPLVVLDVDYAPYGSMPKPVGDCIVWAEVADEAGFVETLAKFGIIRIAERAAL